MSQVTLSPHTQETLVTIQYPSPQELEVAVERSAQAQLLWSAVPLEDRLQVAEKFLVSITAFITRIITLISM